MAEVKPGAGRAPVSKADEVKAQTDPSPEPEQTHPEQVNPPKSADLPANPTADDVRDSSLSVFDAARIKAPSLTREFVKHHELDDDYLMAVATGAEPPPPYVPENDVTELHRTGGGWSVTAKGAKP